MFHLYIYSSIHLFITYSFISVLQVPYKIVGRRAGDVASCYADPKLALEELGWKAERGLDEMCKLTHWGQATHICIINSI